jgi:hypothetical protein
MCKSENTCVDQGPSLISWLQPKKWERRERREKREKMEKVKKEGKNYVCDQTHSLVQVHTSLSRANLWRRMASSTSRLRLFCNGEAWLYAQLLHE